MNESQRWIATSDNFLRTWWKIKYIDYLTSFHRVFLIIINIDVAVMEQRWGGLKIDPAKIRRDGYLMGRLRYWNNFYNFKTCSFQNSKCGILKLHRTVVNLHKWNTIFTNQQHQRLSWNYVEKYMSRIKSYGAGQKMCMCGFDFSKINTCSCPSSNLVVTQVVRR